MFKDNDNDGKNNGEKPEKKPIQERGKNGRFLPGNTFGRATKAKDTEGDFKIIARKIVRDLMKDKDPRIKAKGMELFMKHKHFLDEKLSVVEDPVVLRAIERYANDSVIDVDLELEGTKSDDGGEGN